MDPRCGSRWQRPGPGLACIYACAVRGGLGEWDIRGRAGHASPLHGHGMFTYVNLPKKCWVVRGLEV